MNPVQTLGVLTSAHGRPCPARPLIPDIRRYPQHELKDDDPEMSTKRQENVNTTLRMIDDALRLSRYRYYTFRSSPISSLNDY